MQEEIVIFLFKLNCGKIPGPRPALAGGRAGDPAVQITRTSRMLNSRPLSSSLSKLPHWGQ